MRLAFRKRVSISAIGSVIIASCPSPASFLDTRNQAAARHVAEANTADSKFTINGPGPAAQPTTQPDANPVTRPEFFLIFGTLLVLFDVLQVSEKLGSFGGCGHWLSN